MYADSLRLAQVIANLLTNAAKYTDPHGQIRVTGRCHGGELILKVSDTGIGISADMLPRIFEMFVQVKSALDKSEGGLGIGLALARGLTALHGGSIEADSAGLGSGSTFTLRLPLRQAASALPSDEVSDTAAMRGPSRRILIADDNVDSAESLAMLLRLQGHQVEVVHDGVEALHMDRTSGSLDDANGATSDELGPGRLPIVAGMLFAPGYPVYRFSANQESCDELDSRARQVRKLSAELVEDFFGSAQPGR